MMLFSKIRRSLQRQGLFRFSLGSIAFLLTFARQYLRDFRLRGIRRFEHLVDLISFRDLPADPTIRTKVHFYYLAWGEHLRLLFDYALPSMMQPGNIPALVEMGYEVDFYLYTKEGEIGHIERDFHDCLQKVGQYAKVNLMPVGGYEDDHRMLLQTAAFRDQIQKCLDENAILVAGSCDSIWGNNSVSNGVRLVRGKDICIAAPHPRISREKAEANESFKKLKNYDHVIENNELVKLAFDCAHSSVINSFDDKDNNATHAGLSLRRLNECDIAVISNLPSAYILSLKPQDLKFYTRYLYNEWDKRWSRRLLKENRMKVVGSSQVLFCAELTEDDVGASCKDGLLFNDKYISKIPRLLHNFVCNSYYCHWTTRG